MADASKQGSATLRFTSKVVGAVAILGLLTAAMVWYLVKIEQLDVAAYQQLVVSSQALDVEPEPVISGKQHRVNVRKSVVFSEPEGRRHLRITSRSSDLLFTYSNGEGELLEHMNDVTCDMQEELYYVLPDGREARRQPDGRLRLRNSGAEEDPWVEGPEGLAPMQRIRHVIADTATYYYKKDLFAAEHVNLTRFATSGHRLPEFCETEKPVMQGIAKAVQFSMIGKHTSFRAYHLKMTLYSKEGLL